MKKIFIKLSLLVFILMALMPVLAFAQEQKEPIVEINFFYSPTCPHCAEEKEFLNDLEKEYSQIKINRYNTSENVEFLKELYKEYEVTKDLWGLVPITFTDDNYFLGFNGDVATQIEDCTIACLEKINLFSDNQDCIECDNLSESNPVKDRDFTLPFIGKLNIDGMSPILLSILVGALDGFNACAMIALGFLLTILVSTGIRKRVILIGGVFILVSGIIYFIFISAWLNVFMLLGYVQIINIIVSIIIIVFAIFLLKDYVSGVVCKICVIPEDGKESIFTKIQRKLFVKMTNLSKMEMSLGATILGVALVAAGINMVELACSLGFPLAYTRILTTYNLSTFSYYLHILVYVIFYMLDDFLIFLIAVYTLKITKISDKYLRFVKLISGLILLVLGIVMLFKPEFLNF